MENVPLILGVERELTADDIARLDERPKGKTKAPALQRITGRHHRLARLLAEGMSPGEAGVACGYTPSRVSILLADPAFKELLNGFRSEVAERYRDLHEKLGEVTADALHIISDRLEEDPEQFSNAELMSLAKMGADRTGHGPQSNTNVNVNIGMAERLDAARKRVREQREAEVIEGEILDESD